MSVLPSGEVCATYRKRFLYYTDETWASEPPAPSSFYSGALGDLAKSCAMGICMDINPYKFEAPWTDYEFATHCVEGEAELVVVSMAWLTRLEPEELMKEARSPDLGTLSYWIERFLPVVAASVARKLGKGVEEDYDDEKEVVIVLANRCGMEPGSIKGVSQGVDVDSGEDVVSYAGSSCVLKIKDGNVQIFDMLGKAEESLLVVDTEEVSSSKYDRGEPVLRREADGCDRIRSLHCEQKQRRCVTMLERTV